MKKEHTNIILAVFALAGFALAALAVTSAEGKSVGDKASKTTQPPMQNGGQAIIYDKKADSTEKKLTEDVKKD